jgi:hypothetical protein
VCTAGSVCGRRPVTHFNNEAHQYRCSEHKAIPCSVVLPVHLARLLSHLRAHSYPDECELYGVEPVQIIECTTAGWITRETDGWIITEAGKKALEDCYVFHPDDTFSPDRILVEGLPPNWRRELGEYLRVIERKSRRSNEPENCPSREDIEQYVEKALIEGWLLPIVDGIDPYVVPQPPIGYSNGLPHLDSGLITDEKCIAYLHAAMANSSIDYRAKTSDNTYVADIYSEPPFHDISVREATPESCYLALVTESLKVLTAALRDGVALPTIRDKRPPRCGPTSRGSLRSSLMKDEAFMKTSKQAVFLQIEQAPYRSVQECVICGVEFHAGHIIAAAYDSTQGHYIGPVCYECARSASTEHLRTQLRSNAEMIRLHAEQLKVKAAELDLLAERDFTFPADADWETAAWNINLPNTNWGEVINPLLKRDEEQNKLDRTQSTTFNDEDLPF